MGWEKDNNDFFLLLCRKGFVEEGEANTAMHIFSSCSTIFVTVNVPFIKILMHDVTFLMKLTLEVALEGFDWMHFRLAAKFLARSKVDVLFNIHKSRSKFLFSSNSKITN